MEKKPSDTSVGSGSTTGSSGASSAVPPPADASVSFFVKYAQLCGRRLAKPLPAVTKGQSQAVLDVVTDRLRLVDWLDVLRALRSDQRLQTVAIRLRRTGVKSEHTYFRCAGVNKHVNFS